MAGLAVANSDPEHIILFYPNEPTPLTRIDPVINKALVYPSTVLAPKHSYSTLSVTLGSKLNNNKLVWGCFKLHTSSWTAGLFGPKG